MAELEKWLIGEDTLEYDDATHTYWCNGVKCISVTQLLQFKYPNKYDGIPAEVLKRAGEKGTHLHEAIEVYERYGLPSDELEEFRSYLFLKDKFGFTVEANEVPVILKYKDVVICGRLDLVLKENDLIGLGDIKRTSVLDKEYLAYQLNLYRLAYKQSYKQDIHFLRGIHLRNDKRKYLALPINEEATYELLEDYINWRKT